MTTVTEMQNVYPLVMTAAIDTKGMPGVSVNDVQERSNQYLGTLQFYLQDPAVARIVFIDNSGYALDEFQSLASRYPDKQVELLSCNLNDYPRHLGKSYGELRILDYVADHSLLVSQAGGYFKATGRFPILNVGKLLNEAHQRRPWEMFCDNKDHRVYDWLRLGWTGRACDTRFFGVSLDFYRKFFYGREEELDDSSNKLIEFMFFETVKAASSAYQVIRRFRTEPEYAGKAGHVQTALLQVNDYSGLVAKGKRRIRQMGRWLAPWFWF